MGGKEALNTDLFVEIHFCDGKYPELFVQWYQDISSDVMNCWNNTPSLGMIYPLVINIAMERSAIFKNGKPR